MNALCVHFAHNHRLLYGILGHRRRRSGRRLALRLRHLALFGGDERRQFFLDICGRTDEPRAVADERKAPRARAAVDASRDCHHDAPHVGGARSRDERAALDRRLYRDDAFRERRDRVVALRKRLRVGISPKRKLAHYRATVRHDVASERAVLLGIEFVESRADDADRLPLRGKCAAVRLGVDAERKSRDYRPAVLGKPLRDLERLVEPVGGRAARADDRDGRRRQDGGVALYVERKRVRRLLEKTRRIARIRRRHDFNTVTLCKRELALPVDSLARTRDLLRIRHPRGSDGTSRFDKSRERDGTYLVRQVEGDIRLAFIHFAPLIRHPAI